MKLPFLIEPKDVEFKVLVTINGKKFMNRKVEGMFVIVAEPDDKVLINIRRKYYKELDGEVVISENSEGGTILMEPNYMHIPSDEIADPEFIKSFFKNDVFNN